jgi:hypothetical protein
MPANRYRLLEDWGAYIFDLRRTDAKSLACSTQRRSPNLVSYDRPWNYEKKPTPTFLVEKIGR